MNGMEKLEIKLMSDEELQIIGSKVYEINNLTKYPKNVFLTVYELLDNRLTYLQGLENDKR